MTETDDTSMTTKSRDTETYSDFENSSQIFYIKTKLWQLKQNDREVTDYYIEIKTLF